jgi:glycerol-3-phosphate dehydrogenase
VFHPYWREQALAKLGETFDLLVIGGGITGCGVLLDAAQRGLRVLLVEKHDLAAGTSSRSSKLIHGGLRYLKQMQLRITRLACRERDRLVALSPHLVHPISFLYPAYQGDLTPGWQVDLGLWMYDRLTSGSQRHTHLGPDDIEALAPGLAVADLDRALLFGDAVADDARLTLAVAATGAAYGGLVLTRAEVVGGVRDAGGRLTGVVLEDLEGGRSHRVAAHQVLSATGHWTDVIRERFGLGGTRVRPSRGVHLVFATERLPLATALLVTSPDDGRPVFVIPHREGVLLGTTDVFHDGALDDPRPTREEIDYLLRVAQSAFPTHGLGPADVRGAFAGLRPILKSGVESPSAASREEAIWEEEGLLSVAGGKLTTYRVTAQKAVDRVVERLPEERARRASASATAGTPLAGLAPADLPERLERSARLSPEVARGMAARLGSGAWAALSLASSRRELGPLAPGLDLCPAEVRAHLRHGAVVRLEDLLLRRARLGMWQPAAARWAGARLRSLCTAELGWRRRRWERELEGFESALEAWTPEGVS